MGQKLSQTKEGIVIKVFLEKYFPNYRLLKVLNNGIMYKTVLIIRDKAPLVTKIFVKKYYDESDNNIFKNKKQELISIHKKIFSEKIPPNIAPIIGLEDINLCGMIFRQYYEYSLKERIYINPYLTDIEKIWITFQLLNIVNNLHELGIAHGDLNPENILLTSNLSVYISDIASYKPYEIVSDDIASYTYFFGSNDNTSLKGFYLAPERLLEKGKAPSGERKTSNDEQKRKFDVFSLGVIIAELFLEKNLFTFSSMLNYKKGLPEDINENLKKIKIDELRDLITLMIKVNPYERISILDAFTFFLIKICPITMKGFLIHFNMITNNTIFWKPDLTIGFIYRFWNPIWKMIFGVSSEPIKLNRKLNLEIVNQLIVNNPLNRNQTKSILKLEENGSFIYAKNKFILDVFTGELIVDKNENFEAKFNRDCILIIINYLVKNMKNVKYETSNLAAMEMVKNLSSKLPDIFKLKNILPYFVDNLDRKNFTAKLTSLNYIFEILYSFDYDNLILPATEYNYFDSYIFPVLLKLYSSGSHDLILLFINNIDKMIDLEKKFLNITLKSRIMKYKNSLNQENNNKKNQNENNNFLLTLESVSINNEEISQMENNTKKKNTDDNLISKKNKKSQIFKDYETSSMVFKEELFRVTKEILSKTYGIDIMITCIRKVPDLLSFFGKNNSNDFIKFIISNFNKTDWIIKKEILAQIPKMVITLGQQGLNQYLLLCMEVLITNNSNEFNTYELIKSFHQLLKMGYLQHEQVISIFRKLLPCLVHPNVLIRHEIMELTKSIVNYLSIEEIYSNLYKELSQYISLPLIAVKNKFPFDIILYKKANLDRVIYQLELNNILFKTNEDNSLNLIKDMINEERRVELLDNNNGNINYCLDDNENFAKKLNNARIYDLKENCIKYFNEYFTKIFEKGEQHSIIYIAKEIIGKIFWICSENDGKNKQNKNFFDENDSLISSNFFNFLKYFKILNVSMKLFNFAQLDEKEKKLEDNNNNNDYSSYLKDRYILPNFYYNKSFFNWRPQGQLITTIYSHNKNSVEKLIPLNNNRFGSFDSQGNAFIWKISKKEENYMLEKNWVFEYDDEEHPISYKKAIGLIDNFSFAIGSKNIIYQYEPECSQNNATKLCQTRDGSNVTCLEAFGKSSLELQKIIFCSEKGEINIYDQRMHDIALRNKLSFENGKANCIKESFSKKVFYIGTSGGYLLNYDLRFNSILDTYKYYNNDPIIDIYPFNGNKNNTNESFGQQTKYLIILTASDSHEVGFWNYNNRNCDLLLKVNKNSGSFECDYPKPLRYAFEDKKTKSNKYNLIPDYYNMQKYTHLLNNNYIKLLSRTHSYDDNYFKSFSIFQKNENYYKDSSTVQCISSPFYDMNQNNYKYDNCPYLITAGNDMTIRYWDISKNGMNELTGNNLNESGSYLINAPNKVTFCNFSKCSFNNLTILQSNESCEDLGKRSNIPGFSEYQNYNGITYHSGQQNEFESNIPYLQYCTKNTEPAHRACITDLLSYSISSNEGQSNILISSSWDGTIKIWK
jgi:phosphoinositide-3-kinase regulatory subunit 4